MRIATYSFATFFVIAGINHFVHPDFYLKIIPPYLPAHEAINWVSGAAEVLFGILVAIPSTRRLGGLGAMALLVAVFPANLYVYAHQALLPAPGIVHLLRLPLQAVFIYWAFRAGALGSRRAPS
jgi:uncharacterized membrane protein